MWYHSLHSRPDNSYAHTAAAVRCATLSDCNDSVLHFGPSVGRGYAKTKAISDWPFLVPWDCHFNLYQFRLSPPCRKHASSSGWHISSAIHVFAGLRDGSIGTEAVPLPLCSKQLQRVAKWPTSNSCYWESFACCSTDQTMLTHAHISTFGYSTFTSSRSGRVAILDSLGENSAEQNSVETLLNYFQDGLELIKKLRLRRHCYTHSVDR